MSAVVCAVTCMSGVVFVRHFCFGCGMSLMSAVVFVGHFSFCWHVVHGMIHAAMCGMILHRFTGMVRMVMHVVLISCVHGYL